MKDWLYRFKIPGGAPRAEASKQSMSMQDQCTDYGYARPFTRAITQNLLHLLLRAVESSTAEQNGTLVYMQGNELPLCSVY